MNLLLLRPDELLPDGTARLRGPRLLHAREVLRLSEGDVLRAGILNGLIGTAELVHLDTAEMVLRPTLTDQPPARPGVDLLLALPRPKALRKILPAAASLGVDRIVLTNATRVEKSYFESKAMAPDAVRDLLFAGLEQAKDTRLPEVLVRDRFRPFVEDEAGSLWAEHTKLVAHPAAEAGPQKKTGRAVIAIGPEGGWVPFELDLLRAQGFSPFTLGPRTLRVEVAVAYALGAISGNSR
ncbi:MAG: 16S rRNA (uracil(1498)-N(3))-methyltransferase [Myxococcales bacterium]